MFPKYAKVSEIAERFRVSADAVYLWIRQGKIPADCVVRIAGTVRVDEEQFALRLRAGDLCQPRGRKQPADRVEASLIADDSLTTVRAGTSTEHRWINEGGSVEPEHPFSPEMVAVSK